MQANQGDCHYFFPYTTDQLVIDKNKDVAIQDCLIADFGNISGVIVQNPSGFRTTTKTMIYEGDEILFQKDDFHHLCTIVRKENIFYGSFKDEKGADQFFLMNENYLYDFEEPDSHDDYDNYYNNSEDNCSCCECCGCTCHVYDDD